MGLCLLLQELVEPGKFEISKPDDLAVELLRVNATGLHDEFDLVEHDGHIGHLLGHPVRLGPSTDPLVQDGDKLPCFLVDHPGLGNRPPCIHRLLKNRLFAHDSLLHLIEPFLESDPGSATGRTSMTRCGFSP